MISQFRVQQTTLVEGHWVKQTGNRNTAHFQSV